MSRLKIVRNTVAEDRKLLQARVDAQLVEEINLMVRWSNRDKNEIVAELLRYALSQETDFQEHKRSLPAVEAVPQTASMGGARQTTTAAAIAK